MTLDGDGDGDGEGGGEYKNVHKYAIFNNKK